MTLSASYIEVAELLQVKLESNATALGIQDVFYGDQEKLPRTPAVCVEPDTKVNNMVSAFRKLDIEMTIYLIVYHSSVASPQENRKGSDTLAENVETLIHADKQLLRVDGSASVIHCYISNITSGYVKKGTAIMRASRLTFTAKSQSQLPST